MSAVNASAIRTFEFE